MRRSCGHPFPCCSGQAGLDCSSFGGQSARSAACTFPLLLYHWRCRPLLLRHQEQWTTRSILFGYRIACGKRPAPVELGASLKPGDSLAQRFLYLPKGSIIRVALARPEETFEAIL